MENKLIAKHNYQILIHLVSGLHIGDSSETVQIGGIDNPVIKRRDNKQPYIPGSSLKGKMRSLLEQIEGKNIGGCPTVEKYFGTHKKEKMVPSRFIFRDAYLTSESADMLENNPNLDGQFVEAKYENSVDRITARANPRPLERVPAGAIFLSKIVMNEFSDGPSHDEMKSFLSKGLNLIKNDYLGGSGSRGSGQVDFGDLTLVESKSFLS